MAFKTFWFWRPKQLNEDWAEVHAFASKEYPHPSLVEDVEKPTQATSIWFGSLDESGNLFINWNDPDVLGIAPPLWFIVQESNSPYPNGPAIRMVTLHAMFGEDFPSGTIVKGRDVLRLGIPITAIGTGGSQRVGFVQWFRESSKIQQVLVEEEWRRKRITVAMFGVADLVILSGRYGPYLNGGDVTTGMGETLRSAWSTSSRVLPRSGSVSGT